MATVFVDPTPPVTTGNPEWDRVVGPADTWAHEVLGDDASGMDIRWDVTPGRYGQPPSFRLTLSGDGQSASEHFSGEEITDRREVRFNTLRAWRHLLDAQMRKGYADLARGLRELAEELSDGE